jgi:hypothetical protein
MASLLQTDSKKTNKDMIRKDDPLFDLMSLMGKRFYN